MANAEIEAEQTEEAQDGAKSRRKKLIGMIAAVLLLGGAGAGWWMFGAGNGDADTIAEAGPIDAASLVDVPAMTVNLRTSDGAARMLRIHLMLVPGTAARETIEGQLPLLLDAFQPFLRELRAEDIAGSAATFRVKEEVLVRCHAVLGEGAVRDVLIQDLVQQ